MIQTTLQLVSIIHPLSRSEISVPYGCVVQVTPQHYCFSSITVLGPHSHRPLGIDLPVDMFDHVVISKTLSTGYLTLGNIGKPLRTIAVLCLLYAYSAVTNSDDTYPSQYEHVYSV